MLRRSRWKEKWSNSLWSQRWSRCLWSQSRRRCLWSRSRGVDGGHGRLCRRYPGDIRRHGRNVGRSFGLLRCSGWKERWSRCLWSRTRGSCLLGSQRRRSCWLLWSKRWSSRRGRPRQKNNRCKGNIIPRQQNKRCRRNILLLANRLNTRGRCPDGFLCE